MANDKKPTSLDGAVMTDNGLSFKGAIMQAVIDKCEGCERVIPVADQKYCPTYANPAARWARGACNFATHVKATVDAGGKLKVNPLKASKRAARGR
jgi:hypothetical protein